MSAKLQGTHFSNSKYTDMVFDHSTWSSGGTGPGSMLFMDEYSLGICLSRLHCTHSVSLLSGGNVLTFKPGNFSYACNTFRDL